MGNYREGRETFVNPYNFIPLGDSCDKNYSYKKDVIGNKDSKKTGWIKCELELKTPIFIPNTTKNFKERDINAYNFFSYNDLSEDTKIKEYEPVIPGSELRGVLRSAYETVTNSCLSALDDKNILYKRTPHIAKPAVLKKVENKWILYKCRRAGLFKQNFEEGKQLFLKVNSAKSKVIDFSETLKNDYLIGYYHQGEPFLKKKRESVFFDIDEQGIEIRNENVDNYFKNIELYGNEKINNNLKKNLHRGYKHIKKDRDIHFLYYREINGTYYLSPSAIGREVFNNRIKNAVKNYESCNKINELCPACLLFGTVEGDNAFASRVRITDAKVLGKYEYDSEKYLLLASPKPSATEFYLKKQGDNHTMWNYDYAEINKKPVNNYNAEIRGRKFYWHHKNATYFPGQPSNLCTKIKPLKEGKFTFKVYFNNISEEELKKLVWTIEIGTENGHKIGMGKPYGLGSVKINVKSIKERTINLTEEDIIYDDTKKITKEGLKINGYTDLGCNKDVYDSFIKITKFNNNLNNIAYPTNERSDKIFEWFGGNKQVTGNGNNPIIENTLPKIKENNVSLNKYVKIENNNNRNPRR